LPNNELAERVGLSASACLRRLRRLEEAGIIQGYTPLIDPAVEGWTMTALASIRLSRQHEDEIQMFENAVREWDEVLECHLVTGSRDYVLKVMSPASITMSASSRRRSPASNASIRSRPAS
jgi:Lrp/AsnC family leucine-responsive transcriptional regulator